MKLRSILGLALALAVTPALAQVSPGTSPLSGAKGGTANAFMQFAGPATSLKTYTLANASGTLAQLNQVQTWTGAQSFTDGTLILLGSGSGSSTVKAPATGGGIATLFAGTDTIAGIASAQALTNKTFNCANNTCTVRLGSDVTGQLPIANGGTGQATAAAAITALMPTPTRAGDIVYWNGTNWVALAGNNAGTQVLQETVAGVPSWATVAGTGTVTTLTAGAGVSFSTGATCTNACTVSANLSVLNNSLGSDVLLSNILNYFDGPSVAQGTSGTWWASGTVTVTDLAGSAFIFCKLWDGTTVIASGGSEAPATNGVAAVSLSGYLASPAANIKVSCRDSSSTSGKILFNNTGNSKDSTLSVHRVQ